MSGYSKDMNGQWVALPSYRTETADDEDGPVQDWVATDAGISAILRFLDTQRKAVGSHLAAPTTE